MAVQAGGSSRGVPLYVLIIFIVLFLASVTGLVVLFLHQESVRTQAQQAKTRFDKYVGTKVESQLAAYADRGQAAKKSAVAVLLDDRAELGRLLTGKPDANVADVRDQMDRTVAALPESATELKNQVQADLVGALSNAAQKIQSLSDQLAQSQAAAADAEARAKKLTDDYDALQKAFAESTATITKQLTDMKGEFDKYKASYDEQLTSVEQKVGTSLAERMDKVEKTFGEEITELRNLVRRNLRSLIASIRETGPAEQRTKASLTVDKLLEREDGQVLTRSGDVLYVNLGARDGVKAGMRLYVYAESEQGSAKPEVKGYIELTAVGEVTSEARVVRTQPASPIIPGDLVGNLVFDRELKLTFFVLGGFDFDGNGTPDPNGYQRVREIIAASGGKVADQLSPTVGFVVTGAVPVVPAAPGETAKEQVKKEYQALAKQARDYGELKDQVQALGVPLVAAETFLDYTGYSVPVKNK